MGQGQESTKRDKLKIHQQTWKVISATAIIPKLQTEAFTLVHYLETYWYQGCHWVTNLLGLERHCSESYSRKLISLLYTIYQTNNLQYFHQRRPVTGVPHSEFFGISVTWIFCCNWKMTNRSGNRGGGGAGCKPSELRKPSGGLDTSGHYS